MHLSALKSVNYFSYLMKHAIKKVTIKHIYNIINRHFTKHKVSQSTENYYFKL